jgi:hypothetical protein
MSDADAHIAAEVEATCRRYLAGYPAALWRYLTDGSDIDYDALGFWSFPMMFIIGAAEGGSSVTIVDRDQFDSQVRAVYDQYYVDGWGGDLRLDAAKVSVVSPDVALIETSGTRFRSDGSDFNKWDSCYWMKRTAAGWKQFAVTDTEPPRPPAREWVRWLRAAGGITDG